MSIFSLILCDSPEKSSEISEIYKKLSQTLTFHQPVYINICGGYLVFYFICCIKTYFQVSACLKFSWIRKLFIFFRYMMTTMEEQLYVSTNYLAQKTIGKKNIFSMFLVSKNLFKKRDLCQFLASKFYDKIWHCFNIFCNFCVS